MVPIVHFSKSFLVRAEESEIDGRISHQKVNKETAKKSLFAKSIHKAADIVPINFCKLLIFGSKITVALWPLSNHQFDWGISLTIGKLPKKYHEGTRINKNKVL